MSYERDLDLNLLRVFLVVAEAGSVTEAASRLYVTQPAVSAALKRLQSALGVELVVREGRGIALTTRGRRLAQQVRPHLEAILDATRASEGFDPSTSERVIRLGLSDALERSLLPALLRCLAEEAPHMSMVVLSVQFRTVAAALDSGEVDLAVTVADDLPATVCREPLLRGDFVALFDPRHHPMTDHIDAEAYFAADHVIVSYNGDRRGVIEDLVPGRHRRVRVSVSTFHALGDIIEGSPLIGTVPSVVARALCGPHRSLGTARLPFTFGEGWVELLWRRTLDDDPAIRFVLDHVRTLAAREG